MHRRPLSRTEALHRRRVAHDRASTLPGGQPLDRGGDRPAPGRDRGRPRRRAGRRRGAASRSGARTSPRDRADLIRAAAALMRERQDEIAHSITLEHGKPFRQAQLEVIRGCEFFEWDAGEAVRTYGRVIPSAAGREVRRPPPADRAGRRVLAVELPDEPARRARSPARWRRAARSSSRPPRRLPPVPCTSPRRSRTSGLPAGRAQPRVRRPGRHLLHLIPTTRDQAGRVHRLDGGRAGTSPASPRST